MSTIFPPSASAGQTYEGYYFNGTTWDIIGVDLTADYPEITNGYISASVIPDVIARVDYVDTEIANIDALPSQSGHAGEFLTTSGSAASWASVDALPSQGGHTGQFLTTSGSVASWASVDALPSQTGESGKFLTTDGSNASWATVDLSSAINTASAAAVTYLVDGAPSALNTLNELSAALNDDENFASTITTSLGTKLDSSTASTTYLTQVSASTTYAPLNSPSLTTPNIGSATGTSLLTTGNIVGHINIITPTFSTNAYTLTGSEDGALLMLDNSSTAGTLNIPTDATYNFTIGTQITAVQKGTGQITIAASNSGTTTVNSTPGLKFRTQWSSATLLKTAANTWLVMGDMEA